MAEKESLEGPIVFIPDLVRLCVGCLIRTRKRTVKPFGEPLSGSEKGDAAEPDWPVTEVDIELEVGRPAVVVYVL